MRPLFTLLLVLLLPLSVAAYEDGENYYEYKDFKVYVSEPITLCTPARDGCPSERHIGVRMPGYAIPGLAYLKNCAIWAHRGRPEWWDGVPVVMDRFRTVYGSGANYGTGTIRITVGDTAPERESTVCLRVPFYVLGH